MEACIDQSINDELSNLINGGIGLSPSQFFKVGDQQNPIPFA